MEVCVDNIQSVLNAAAGGAARIELCSALSEGGLTPSLGFFKTAKSLVNIPIFIMLRPRRGTDFVYSEEEIQSMKYDALEFVNAGVDGIVFGILNENGTINQKACLEILEIVKPLPVTFHRAFDCVTDPIQSLNELIDLGFDRILTSGQAKNASEGLEMLKKLINIANNRIIIMPGAGVNETNVYDILKCTGAKEIHGSVKRSITLSFKGKKEATMGSNDANNEIFITDIDIVKQIVSIVNKFKN